jgi:magnesium chelatase subunit D
MDVLDAVARWEDAALAVELLAVEPAVLGGLRLQAWPGPARDLVCRWLNETVRGPVVRLPLHITDDRLLGGLALSESLKTGAVVLERGVLAQADGGVVLVPMAERLSSHVSALLCAALDRGHLTVEREGLRGQVSCRLGVLALDEGLEDEAPPRGLSERLALQVDLREVPPRLEPVRVPDAARVQAARARLAAVTISDARVEVLCQTADALGVPSVRSPLLAVAVARVHAALNERTEVDDVDAAAAARLVLGPRATRLPAPPPAQEEEAQEPSAPDEPEAGDGGGASGEQAHDPSTAEVVLAAAKSAIPPGLLELLAPGRAQRTGPRSAGKVGAARASTTGGRPAGSRAAVPQPGDRLNVVETLRAAAPWQRLRRPAGSRRVEVRNDDLRVNRFVQRTESVVIFCVDASGSSALQRLAEAKGAVEQVLADCYVRRDHVALVAFRGSSASVVLPPTRSLARARRCLAELAGGGGTPMSAGIDAATSLALEARRRGRSPLVVMMTDGRANVGRAGSSSPQDDALSSARTLRAQQVRALFLDTSPRPRPQAQALAVEMGARYLPLPHVDARVVASRIASMTEVA